VLLLHDATPAQLAGRCELPGKTQYIFGILMAGSLLSIFYLEPFDRTPIGRQHSHWARIPGNRLDVRRPAGHFAEGDQAARRIERGDRAVVAASHDPGGS